MIIYFRNYSFKRQLKTSKKGLVELIIFSIQKQLFLRKTNHKL